MSDNTDLSQKRFEWGLSAIIGNASDHPYRQGRLIVQAVRHGLTDLETAKKLRDRHRASCTDGELERALEKLNAEEPWDPDRVLDEEADLAMTEPPHEFEPDPADPFGDF